MTPAAVIPPRAAGFTLVEMLTVMLLVGIASLAVTLNFARSDRSIVRDEGLRIAVDIESAQDRGRYSGRTVAFVLLGPDQYRFLQKDRDNQWIAAEGALAAPRRLEGCVIETAEADGIGIRYNLPIPLRGARGSQLALVVALNDQRLRLTTTQLGYVESQWLN